MPHTIKNSDRLRQSAAQLELMVAFVVEALEHFDVVLRQAHVEQRLPHVVVCHRGESRREVEEDDNRVLGATSMPLVGQFSCSKLNIEDIGHNRIKS